MKTNIILTALVFLLLQPVFLYPAENPKVLNKEAVEFGKKKMYPEAIKEFDKAIDIYDNSSSKVLHNRAYASEQKGDIKAAINNYEEALRRNPKQLISGERAGLLYYKTGDYDNAVRVGEHVLKIDPKNSEIPKWLPDAYLKKMQRQKMELAAEKKKADEAKAAKLMEQKKLEDERTIVYATLDFMIRTGYDVPTNAYNIVLDKGLFMDLPESIYVRVTPTKSWEIVVLQESPFLGGTMPEVCMSTETVDFKYKFEKFSLGAGILLNHYIGTTALSQTLALTDFKVGIVFGFKGENTAVNFSIYPRLIPSALMITTGIIYDTDWYLLDYEYNVSHAFKIYSNISIREFFFINNSVPVSDYYGLYEFTLGAMIGLVNKDVSSVGVSLSIEFTERFYTRDIGNAQPYAFMGNGQGWFGMNFNKWLTGSPFSGFWANSHSFAIRVDEYVHKYVFLYQKFLFEMPSQASTHYEFNFLIGFGFRY